MGKNGVNLCLKIVYIIEVNHIAFSANFVEPVDPINLARHKTTWTREIYDRWTEPKHAVDGLYEAENGNDCFKTVR